MNFMHWMQRIHLPTARKQCIDEGYRLGSGDIEYRNGAFLSFTIVQFPFDGSSSSIELGFPPALDGSGMLRAFYAWSTAGLMPPKSENASVRTVADRCRVHSIAAYSAL